MKTLLLTGADGFIGSHLLPVVQPAFSATMWAGGPTDYRSERVSLTDPTTYPAGSSVAPINQLIHLAALTKKSNPDPTPAERYRSINVDGTRALLSWLDSHPLEHVLYVSTCDVYGATAGELSESTPASPADPYAASKLAAEEVVQAYAEGRGIPWAVARLGNVYGPGEGAYGKLVPVVIGQALAGDTIRLAGTGATLRDCIFVGDVASALRWIAERRLGGVFNVVSGMASSLMRIAQEIVSLAASPSQIALDSSRPNGADRTFSPSRLVGLGWKPKFSLREGLAAEIDFLRKQRR